MKKIRKAKLIKDLDEPIEGKNVLIVEDILDTLPAHPERDMPAQTDR